VIRTENAAEVLYHEMSDDPKALAVKVIEFAKKYDVPISDQSIFVDRIGRGHELCVLIAHYAIGQFFIEKYGNRQRYGVDLTEESQRNDGHFVDIYARSYSKLAGWLRNGGKLLGRPIFDDLLYMVYTEQNGKMKMIDKDTLMEQGIDSSIPDAFALTITRDKRVMIRPSEDDEWENELPQYPYIGI
jgi:hypothetical protein